MYGVVHRGTAIKPAVPTCHCEYGVGNGYSVDRCRCGTCQCHPRCDPCDTLEILISQQFLLRPYIWILYIIGVVIRAEGALCASPLSSNAVDYNAVLIAESATLYYYAGNEEKHRLFYFQSILIL